MRRFLLLSLLLASALLAPSAASARIYEVGATIDNPAPSCPPKDSCRVVTRTTAYQVRSGTKASPVTIVHGGHIVAFTLRIGDMSKKIIHYFNKNYGGPPRVRLTVLRRAKSTRKGHKSAFLQVADTSAEFHLQPYFGSTAQFVLRRPLGARRGDVIALTVPTWAPVLAVGLGTSDQWAASRPKSACDDNATQTALGAVKAEARFACTYTTQRMTYTATVVATPQRKYDKHQNPIR